MEISAKLRIVLSALLFALVVFHCFFTGLGKLGLVGPDEPRYASIAREMARSGDWVTPRLNGSPWFEKPPLYYWSAAIGFRLFASPEVAARAPCGVFSLCAVLGIVLVGLRVYGASTARALGWMLPASVAMIGFARAAATDMPFAACLTLSMCAAAPLLLDDQPAHPAVWAAAFGAALGLAVLAKGPAALILSGGSTALWAVARGDFRRSFRLLHPAAIAVFLLVALPWYVLCAARNPEFLRTFLLEHNVERFLTNRYQHHQPFWFYFPILLLAVFPWTLLLIPAIADGWRALRSANWRQSPGAYFAGWVIFPFLFFSAAQSKLPGYILPAVPPLILLLSRAMVRDEPLSPSLARARLLWIAAALLAGGIAAVIRSNGNLPSPAAQQPLGLVGVTLIFGAGIVVLAGAWRALRQSAAAASLVISLAAGLAANHLLPALDAQISPRAVAIRAQGLGPLCQTYHLARSWQYGLEFYLQDPVKQWSAGAPRPIWIITDDVGRAQLTAQGWPLIAHGPETPRATLFRVGPVLPTR